MNTRSTKMLAAVLATAMLAVAGCSGPDPSSPPPASEGDIVVYETQAELEAAAQEEGRLSIYISPDYSYLTDGFKEAYPWATLDIMNAPPVQIASKWTTEFQSGISLVDIAFIQPLAAGHLVDLDAVAAVRVPNNLLLPEGLRNEEFRTHPVNVQPIIIGYNTNLLDEGPKSLEELADPKWSGKIAMDDPQLNSSAAWVLASTRAAWGEDKWNTWIEGLTANRIRLTGNAGDSYQTTLQGERPVCLCTYGDFAQQAPGTPMAVQFYDDPNGQLSYSIVATVAAKAPHPAMGALFLNWTLSPEGGQRAFSDHSRLPSVPIENSAIALPEGVELTDVMGLITDYIDNPDRYKAAFTGLSG